jgi:hypothetical protein
MSKINRYNYETYFLLYADNELSAIEKKNVDEFVQSNPELGEELVMLLQTISQKEDILLNNKMSLYKKEPLSSDQQEKLLLHLDNELNEVEKNEVAALIKSSKSFSEEWDMVKYAKFFPESTIVYEDKKSLYRTEKERLVYLPLRKLLAAAILVGVGLWGGWMYLNNSFKYSSQITPNLENKSIAAEIKKDSSESANQIKKLLIEQSRKRANVHPSEFVDEVPNFPESGIDRMTLASEESSSTEMPDLSNSHSVLVDLINKVDNEKKSHGLPNYSEMLEKKLSERSNELGFKLVSDQQINELALSMNNSNTADISENKNEIFLIGEEKLKRIMSGRFFVKVKKSLQRRSHNQNILNTIKVANFEFTIR